MVPSAAMFERCKGWVCTRVLPFQDGNGSPVTVWQVVTPKETQPLLSSYIGRNPACFLVTISLMDLFEKKGKRRKQSAYMPERLYARGRIQRNTSRLTVFQAVSFLFSVFPLTVSRSKDFAGCK